MRKGNDEEYSKIDYELEEKERRLKPNSLPGESALLAYIMIFGIIFIAIVIAVAVF